MAILTEEELQARLENPGNYCVSHGRSLGAKELSPGLRELIGLESHFESANAVAKRHNVSPITAHKAKKSEGVEEKLNIVGESVIHKMLVALNAITDDNITELKTKEKVTFAKDMATIVDVTREKKIEPVTAQVVIYAPVIKEETAYQTIDIEKAG